MAEQNFRHISPGEESMYSFPLHDRFVPAAFSDDEGSFLTVSCPPEHYLASRLALAVEDVDAHLLGLHSHVDHDGLVHAKLHTSRNDPSAVARSLERYGFRVESMEGHTDSEADRSAESLENLRRYLQI